MPLRTYSTGMRIRLALGVVTSIDPEILLLDEGIGAVDAAFLEKSQGAAGGARGAGRAAGLRLALRRVPARAVRHRHLDGARPDQAAGRRSRGPHRLQGPDPVETPSRWTGVPAERERSDRVVAVIVTRHRARAAGREPGGAGRRRAGRSTTSWSSTTGRTSRPTRWSRRAALPATYLPSQRNLGGAGGFALGMLHALALGADWVWCADDDGRPGRRRRCWRRCWTARERHGLAEVSPLVTDMADPERLAFPLRRGLRWRRRRSDFAGIDVLPGYASLFNGALFRADALDVVGVPDYRLFFRGDETEIHRRLVRSGLPFGTALHAAYLHPEGTDGVPADPRRAAVGAVPGQRGQALLHLPQPRLPDGAAGHALAAPAGVVRFSWFFLSTAATSPGWREWLRLVRPGRRERFTRP